MAREKVVYWGLSGQIVKLEQGERFPLLPLSPSLPFPVSLPFVPLPLPLPSSPLRSRAP